MWVGCQRRDLLQLRGGEYPVTYYHNNYDWAGIIDLAYQSYRPGSEVQPDATISPNGVVDIPMDSEFPFLKMAVARRYISKNDL